MRDNVYVNMDYHCDHSILKVILTFSFNIRPLKARALRIMTSANSWWHKIFLSLFNITL